VLGGMAPGLGDVPGGVATAAAVVSDWSLPVSVPSSLLALMRKW